MNAQATSPQIIPGQEVERIGIMLFGSHMMTARMAGAFGVSSQTTRRWRDEGAPREAFMGHLARHAIRLRRAANEIDRLILGED